MAAEIILKIVTPTQTVFEGEVERFTAPGAMGVFQVLRNHAPLVSKLVPGLLRFSPAGKPEEHYYVSGGFLELHKNQGIVLADSAMHSSAINVAEVEAGLKDLQRRYSDHEINNEQYHHEQDILNAKLYVAKARNHY